MCMCAALCVSVFTCVWMHAFVFLRRPDVDFGCLPQFLYICICWGSCCTQSFLVPVPLVSKLASRLSCVSLPQRLLVLVWALGFYSSHLHNKCCIHWPASPASILHLEQIPAINTHLLINWKNRRTKKKNKQWLIVSQTSQQCTAGGHQAMVDTALSTAQHLYGTQTHGVWLFLENEMLKSLWNPGAHIMKLQGRRWRGGGWPLPIGWVFTQIVGFQIKEPLNRAKNASQNSKKEDGKNIDSFAWGPCGSMCRAWYIYGQTFF